MAGTYQGMSQHSPFSNKNRFGLPLPHGLRIVPAFLETFSYMLISVAKMLFPNSLLTLDNLIIMHVDAAAGKVIPYSIIRRNFKLDRE